MNETTNLAKWTKLVTVNDEYETSRVVQSARDLRRTRYKLDEQITDHGDGN